MKKRYLNIVFWSWGLVVGWMFLIFILSAQHAEQSANLSGGITEAVKVFVDQVAPNSDVNIESLSFFVRKNAHFFAYLLLGLFSLNAFRRSGFNMKKSALLAFLLSVLYAISDEIHQLYVPGRSGQVSDVLLDSAGALTGIALYIIVSRFRRSRKQPNKQHQS